MTEAQPTNFLVYQYNRLHTIHHTHVQMHAHPPTHTHTHTEKPPAPETQLLPPSKPVLGCLCTTQTLESGANKSSWDRTTHSRTV